MTSTIVTEIFVKVLNEYLVSQAGNLRVGVGTGQDTWDTALPVLSPSVGGLFREVANKPIQSIHFINPGTGEVSEEPTTVLKIISQEFTESDYAGDIRECALFLNTPLGPRMLLCSVFDKVNLGEGTVFQKTYNINPY